MSFYDEYRENKQKYLTLKSSIQQGGDLQSGSPISLIESIGYEMESAEIQTWNLRNLSSDLDTYHLCYGDHRWFENPFTLISRTPESSGRRIYENQGDDFEVVIDAGYDTLEPGKNTPDLVLHNLKDTIMASFDRQYSSLLGTDRMVEETKEEVVEETKEEVVEETKEEVVEETKDDEQIEQKIKQHSRLYFETMGFQLPLTYHESYIWATDFAHHSEFRITFPKIKPNENIIVNTFKYTIRQLRKCFQEIARDSIDLKMVISTTKDDETDRSQQKISNIPIQENWTVFYDPDLLTLSQRERSTLLDQVNKYYLDTSWERRKKTLAYVTPKKSIEEITWSPQMTFGVRIRNVHPVFEYLCRSHPQMNKLVSICWEEADTIIRSWECWMAYTSDSAIRTEVSLLQNVIFIFSYRLKFHREGRSNKKTPISLRFTLPSLWEKVVIPQLSAGTLELFRLFIKDIICYYEDEDCDEHAEIDWLKMIRSVMVEYQDIQPSLEKLDVIKQYDAPINSRLFHYLDKLLETRGEWTPRSVDLATTILPMEDGLLKFEDRFFIKDLLGTFSSPPKLTFSQLLTALEKL